MTQAGYRGHCCWYRRAQRHGDLGRWRIGDHDADVVVVTDALGWIP